MEASDARKCCDTACCKKCIVQHFEESHRSVDEEYDDAVEE